MNIRWISSLSVMPEMSSLGVFFGGIFFFLPGDSFTPVTPTHIYRKYHISTHFLIKIIFFHFPPKEKLSYFLEKRNTIFPDITKKIMTIFSEHLKKISYFQVFFWERSSFLLCLKNKIIFSGKRNIIFPGNTRKIIFQCNFFWKDYLFKTFGKRKYGFSGSDNFFLKISLIIVLENVFLHFE